MNDSKNIMLDVHNVHDLRAEYPQLDDHAKMVHAA